MTQVTSLTLANLINDGKMPEAIQLMKAQGTDHAIDLALKVTDLISAADVTKFRQALCPSPVEPNHIWHRTGGDPLSQAGQRIGIRI